MSDELNRPKAQDEAEDEVEAHRGHPKFNANAEAGDEADDSGDEVEAHRLGGHKMN